MDAETAAKPIKVQIVPTETAPVERRSTTTSFVPGAPQQILPLSNKRIQAVISVVAIATGNTGNAFLCKDAASAKDVLSGNNNSGSILGAGTFTVVGTGEWWLASTGATNLLVGVVAEYET
jgi:hypothetical protein